MPEKGDCLNSTKDAVNGVEKIYKATEPKEDKVDKIDTGTSLEDIEKALSNENN